MAVAAETADVSPKENFAALLDESLGVASGLEGTVIKGRVIAIENDAALIDVGLKSEGRVALKEFSAVGGAPDIHVGDIVEVFLERMEDKNGEAQLSREKARREEAWTLLEKSFQANERVTGTIYGRVKGGFTVDLNGAIAFLPGSQVDIRPVRDITPLLGSPQPFQILKMDRSRGNIVVSRRAVLEESRAEQRNELVANLREGQVLDGVVKNITDYGAFVDLGGVDGLLHVTDIAWRRINHPSEALSIGQEMAGPAHRDDLIVEGDAPLSREGSNQLDDVLHDVTDRDRFGRERQVTRLDAQIRLVLDKQALQIPPLGERLAPVVEQRLAACLVDA